MTDRINLLCDCGNAMRAKREDTDPPDAFAVWTSLCSICDDGGRFEEIIYLRRAALPRGDAA